MSVAVAATCQQTSREGWPGVRVQHERLVFRDDPAMLLIAPVVDASASVAT